MITVLIIFFVFRQLMKTYMISRSKEECQDLPSKSEVVVSVKMYPDQQRLYREAISAKQGTKARQIATHPKIVDDTLPRMEISGTLFWLFLRAKFVLSFLCVR